MAKVLKTDSFPIITSIRKERRTLMVGFTKCPFCVQADEILTLQKGKGNFEYIMRSDNPKLEAEVRKCFEHETYPMIFVDGEFVGGCSELRVKYAK